MDDLEKKIEQVHLQMRVNIRNRMRRKRWSGNRLADLSGIGRGYLSDILAGKKSPTLRSLVKIASAFSVEVQDLLG